MGFQICGSDDTLQFAEVKFHTLLNFILDFKKLNKGHNLTMKQAEIHPEETTTSSSSSSDVPITEIKRCRKR